MRDTRLRNTDHIVLGGERLRLVVVKDTTSAPGIAGKRTLPTEFCATPIDEEGDDLIVKGATDEVPAVPAVAGSRKRKKVRCHKKLITIMDGAFKKRAGIGGWEYTVLAHILEY